MKKKKCPRCGYELEEDWIKCPRCGLDLTLPDPLIEIARAGAEIIFSGIKSEVAKEEIKAKQEEKLDAAKAKEIEREMWERLENRAMDIIDAWDYDIKRRRREVEED